MFSADAHKEIINCIDGVGGLGIGEGAPEIVTGSRDGKCAEVVTNRCAFIPERHIIFTKDRPTA